MSRQLWLLSKITCINYKCLKKNACKQQQVRFNSLDACIEKSRFVNEWMKSLIRVRLLVRNASDGKPQCCIHSSASCVS